MCLAHTVPLCLLPPQQNAGAKHTGKFSRLQFFHNPRGKGNSWQDLSAKLPGAAHSLYFKDLIGNISSSDTRKSSSAVRGGALAPHCC